MLTCDENQNGSDEMVCDFYGEHHLYNLIIVCFFYN